MDENANDSVDFLSRFWRSTATAIDLPSEVTAATLDDHAFRLLADNIPTLCWIADGDGYIVWYNRRWHEYCGTTPEQMEGWGWQAVHDQDLLPSVLERWTEAIGSGEPFEMTFPLRGADGQFRPFLTRIQPVRNPAGKVVRWFGVNTEVSELQAAEQALRTERDRNRAVLENMAEGFMLLDSEFRVVDINAEGLRIEGRTREEIIGRTQWELWPGSEDRQIGLLYKYAMAQRARVGLEHRYTWPDGRDSWFDMRAFPSGDGVASFFSDITERRAAADALKASEARFRAVAETMPGFVWTADGAGRLDYTSPNWHSYSGADPGESDGAGWASFVHPDDQARVFERWMHAVATLAPYETEFRLRRQDGQYRWWLARAKPTPLAPDDAVRWIGTCTDVEDIIAARETLARSSEDLERLVATRTAERDRLWRSSQDILVAIDGAGRIVSVNPAATAILGFAADEMIGRDVLDFIVPEDRPLTFDALAQAAQGLLPITENRCRHKEGGYRWMSWVAAPEGDLIFATGRHVTAEKQADEALKLTEDALRQSQKMEAVGQLTGGIAHDFNNMLAVVIGSLDLLTRRGGVTDPKASRYVEAAVEGARRAASLTQRLLAFSRQQPLQPQMLDPNSLVAGMSDLLRHSLGTDVQLETALAGGIWRTHADPNQLENAILNLAVNARDAMPDGGRLTIETRNAHLDELHKAVEVGVTPGQYVLIAVSDTGSGMSPEVMAKVFDPFFTTKEVGKGTGLGLSQVYGFVKQSGGHVRLVSEPGRGTTVRLYLPRLNGGEAVIRAEAPPAELPLGGMQELVLVVDDETTVRRFSAEALGELGYRVIEADGAIAALGLLAAHPDIALLFTDIVMPQVNGAKLADQARRIRPDLRILFTTGFMRDTIAHDGVLDPGIDLIGKPFTIEELAAKVRAVLDG